MSFSFRDILSREGARPDRTTTYHHLDLEEEEEQYEDSQKEVLLEANPISKPERKKERKESLYRRCARDLFPVSVVLFLLSFGNVIFSIFYKPGCTERQCVAKTSLWSPALEAVEYSSFDFRNSFGQKSPYRGPPTPELEQLWENLYVKHAIQIPADKLPLLNRSSSSNLQHVPKNKGTGYKALLEVFHQIHCLNRIRQYTWLQSGNYVNTTASENDDPMGVPIPVDFAASSEVANRMHIDHCIETLRHTLTCHSDITPLLVVEDPGAPTGQSLDFNTHHKCRNFDKISEWMDENVADW